MCIRVGQKEAIYRVGTTAPSGIDVGCAFGSQGGGHSVDNSNGRMDMGGSARASSEAHHAEVEPLAKYASINSRERSVPEDSASVLARKEAESLDGTHVGNLFSIATIRTSTAAWNSGISGVGSLIDGAG